MNISERAIKVPKESSDWKEGLVRYFDLYFGNMLKENEFLIRFVVVETDEKFYHCELQIGEGKAEGIDKIRSRPLLYYKRKKEDTSSFNIILNIPTGVDAEIGGESGDATPVARMLAQECDTLILHPNVVNASDINEMTPNTLYVEGSILSRFMMGTVGLKKVRSNKVLMVVDDNQFADYSVNAVSAMRASCGIYCSVLKVKDLYRSEIKYAPSGRPTGEVKNIGKLLKALWEYRKKNPFDALAISSYVHCKKGLMMDYFINPMINPWGGIEAMITHAVATSLEIPTAHAPIVEDMETMTQMVPIVNPRKSAEAISRTFLPCVLKGLYKSPQIITDEQTMRTANVLTAENISALVIPDGCLGQTVFAAIDQNIPVIAVKNRNIMKNDLTKLPFREGQLIQVNNYLEACGVLSAMKAGISLDTVRRPIEYTKVVNYEQ